MKLVACFWVSRRRYDWNIGSPNVLLDPVLDKLLFFQLLRSYPGVVTHVIDPDMCARDFLMNMFVKLRFWLELHST